MFKVYVKTRFEAFDTVKIYIFIFVACFIAPCNLVLNIRVSEKRIVFIFASLKMITLCVLKKSINIYQTTQCDNQESQQYIREMKPEVHQYHNKKEKVKN